MEVLTEALWNKGPALSALFERTRQPGKRGTDKPVKVRQHQKHLTRTERAEAVKRYEAGESMGALVTAFGCHRSAIRRALEARNVELRDWRTRLVDVDQAKVMYESGETAQRIADELGVSPTAVLTHLRSAEVVLRPRGKVAR